VVRSALCFVGCQLERKQWGCALLTVNAAAHVTSIIKIEAVELARLKKRIKRKKNVFAGFASSWFGASVMLYCTTSI